MSLAEITILAVMALSVVFILIRCFGVREGKVIKQYQIGKAMTIGNRQIQEDYYGLSRTPQGLLAVLADGMGSNYGGKIAGKIAADTITEIYTSSAAHENPTYFFKRAFQAANQEILKELDEGRGGASVAAVVLHEDALFYGLAGNIQIGVFRDGQLVRISTGHTLSALAEKHFHQGSFTREDVSGEILNSKRLYNYLGQDGFQEIEFGETSIALRERDIVVLMSDGVFETISWRELEDCLSRSKTCQARALEVMEIIQASSKKDKDNASIVLIERT